MPGTGDPEPSEWNLDLKPLRAAEVHRERPVRTTPAASSTDSPEAATSLSIAAALGDLRRGMDRIHRRLLRIERALDIETTSSSESLSGTPRELGESSNADK